MPLIPVDAETTADLARDGAEIIDVREENEWAAERIPGARLTPLSHIEDFAESFDGKTVVFHCRSGNRTTVQAPRIEAAAAGAAKTFVLAGGILEWKAAGLPTER